MYPVLRARRAARPRALWGSPLGSVILDGVDGPILDDGPGGTRGARAYVEGVVVLEVFALVDALIFGVIARLEKTIYMSVQEGGHRAAYADKLKTFHLMKVMMAYADKLKACHLMKAMMAGTAILRTLNK